MCCGPVLLSCLSTAVGVSKLNYTSPPYQQPDGTSQKKVFSNGCGNIGLKKSLKTPICLVQVPIWICLCALCNFWFQKVHFKSFLVQEGLPLWSAWFQFCSLRLINGGSYFYHACRRSCGLKLLGGVEPGPAQNPHEKYREIVVFKTGGISRPN